MFGGGRGPAMMMEREVLKPKNVGETLKRFGTYFRPYVGVLLLVATFVIISTWAQVTSPDLIGQAVDCYLTPTAAQQFGGFTGSGVTQSAADNCWYDPDPTHTRTSDQNIAGLGGLILKIIGLFLLSAILTGLTFFGMSWAGQHVLRRLRTEVFEHIHRLSLSYYAEHEAGDVMSRITNDADTIQQALSFALINVIGGALLLIWIAYTMMRLSFAYALIALVAVPFMWFATRWFSGQARKAFRKSRLEMGSVNAELQQSISSVREVQAFNRERENIENFRDVNAANRDANIRAVAFTAALPPTLEALGFVAMALVVGVGGLLILRNQDLFGTAISIGLIVTFLAYVQRFNQPIQQIAVLWTNIQSAIAGGERIFGLLDEVPAVQDKVNAIPMPTINGTVEFKAVHAEYELDVPVLRGIDFTAQPGQMIAVVGPTGAGKTTIINLVPRFYDVTGGTVKIDGIDVRDVTAASLRKQIGIVLQDSFLFSDTVMNNIRFGRPEATEEEVIAAAKLARADTFIDRLSDGYQTILGERGSGLSQGQRQLLSIARAALANPRILILDEATSSVDTRTEKLIQDALEKLLHGRTSFVVAHRLSTIKHADQIFVLKDGEIIERGKFNELLNAHGFFYDLYMSQFRRQEQIEGATQPSGNGQHATTVTATA